MRGLPKMNVTIIQGRNLTTKTVVEPKISYGLRGKPRFQIFDTCVCCGEQILRIKYPPRKYCDDCHKGKLQSDKGRRIKGLTPKEYQHQYYLKTVALGWRHY